MSAPPEQLPPAASRKGSERAWQQLNSQVPAWVQLVAGDPVQNANWFRGAMLQKVSRDGKAVVAIPSRVRAGWLNQNFKRATVRAMRKHGMAEVVDVVFIDKGSSNGSEA